MCSSGIIIMEGGGSGGVKYNVQSLLTTTILGRIITLYSFGGFAFLK